MWRHFENLGFSFSKIFDSSIVASVVFIVNMSNKYESHKQYIFVLFCGRFVVAIMLRRHVYSNNDFIE